MEKFNKVAIIGVGEIGGSIGLDLRRKRLAKKIIGIGRKESKSLPKAKRVGAVDRITRSIEEGVKDADLIILAAPVKAIIDLGIKAIKSAKPGAIITDVGSTKKEIVGQLDKITPKGVSFVGSHPMAGTEKGGPLNSQENLFKGRNCFITRTKHTNNAAFKKIEKLWRCLGANTIEINPLEHDRIVARISQMVHLVASALVISGKGALKYAASGFQDTTRIALADPRLWIDICLTNNIEINKSIDDLIKILKAFKKALSQKDKSKIGKLLAEAREKRQSCKI